MIKYLIKEKIKKEVSQDIKKMSLYMGIGIVTTAGTYFSYKIIKRMKNCKKEEIQYLENKDYEELKEKID